MADSVCGDMLQISQDCQKEFDLFCSITSDQSIPSMLLCSLIDNGLQTLPEWFVDG